MRLATIFTTGMVFQREMPIRVFGEGKGKVKIEFCTEVREYENTSDEKWEIEFPPMSAGGPYSMKIDIDGEKKVLEDILVGDVWICGGQSNMEQILARTDNGLEYAENCREENIRFFTVPRRLVKDEPYTCWHFFLSENMDTPWEICDTESAWYFSAIGFHFAKKVYAETGVPIGMINCNWGGTQIEPYIEKSLCRKEPSVSVVLDMHEENLVQIDNEKYEKDFAEARKKEIEFFTKVRRDSVEEVRNLGLRAAEYKLYNSGVAVPYGKYSNTIPGSLYDSMVSRIVPFGVKGVLWYQGESNAHGDCKTKSIHRTDYSKKYKALMDCWRGAFKNPDMPFYAVELAPYKRSWNGNDHDDVAWAYLREEQMKATEYENSYLVSSCDNDDGYTIHPTNKDTVGLRVAYCVLKNTYGRNIFPVSPSYKSVEFKDGKAYIKLNGSNVIPMGGTPYMRICGKDKVFHGANVAAEGDTIVVWNPDIKEPVAVRYCFSDYFVATIYSEDGMPLHPFRTDDFELFGE